MGWLRGAAGTGGRRGRGHRSTCELLPLLPPEAGTFTEYDDTAHQSWSRVKASVRRLSQSSVTGNGESVQDSPSGLGWPRAVVAPKHTYILACFLFIFKKVS